MIRLVPNDEAEFRDKVANLIKDFAMDEGISFHAVNDSIIIENSSLTIALQLWWIRNNVAQTDFDRMNTKEERKKMSERMDNVIKKMEEQVDDAKRAS